MKIRVLGCHGSDQLLSDGRLVAPCQPCAFLINDRVLIDAGTIGSRLTLQEQRHITHVFLSHLHFDHIRSLPSLADNLAGELPGSVVVAGTPEVLGGLRSHVFNGAVYPDFFRLPSPDRSVLIPQFLKLEQEWKVAGLTIVPIKVNHVVPTVGFLISDEFSTLLYSGDTYQTEALWRAASCMPNLKAALIEVSYPNDQAALAYTAKHLTPNLMASEFRKIGRQDLRVYAYHLKPRYRSVIEAELRHVHTPAVTVLDEQSELEL